MDQNNVHALMQQFQQFDNDKDGKISGEEAYELLKMLGKNIYKGSILDVTYS